MYFFHCPSFDCSEHYFYLCARKMESFFYSYINNNSNCMKKINVILMLAFTVLVCSLMGCSQDDDNYESDMYTLAEMGTRLGGKGDPGGSTTKKKIIFDPYYETLPQPTNILLPMNMSSLPNSANSVLSGEYDTETLTISISNYNGNAQISILTVESGYLMSSATVAVSSESSIDFSLLDYPTSAYYQIFVTLGSDTYYGVFDL